MLGCSTGGQAESGDDLVEDEECAGGVAGRPEPFEESGCRGDEPHVGGNRFDDDGSHRVIEFGHPVVGGDDGVGDRSVGDAVAAGEPLVGDAAAAGGEEGVGVAMVAAGELDDAVASGGAPGQPDGGHGGLGAAGDEPNRLEAGDPVDDHLG